MYADSITESMQRTIDETKRRREKQLAYNAANNIVPTAIVKGARASLSKTGPLSYVEPEGNQDIAADPVVRYMSRPALEKAIAKTKKSMHEAAARLDFLEAARLRDEMIKLEELLPQKT